MINDRIEKEQSWRIVKRYKSGFLTVYQVERVVAGKVEKGFFKYASSAKQEKYIGPLVVNELVSYQLGTILGLPVARTEFAQVDGMCGIVSFAHGTAKVSKWSDLKSDVLNDIDTFIVEPERLFQTFVFDAWVCNIDRSGKNIIMYREGNQYNFYLIDHELTLLGALRFENKPWNAPFWEDIHQYTRGYHPALLSYMKDYSRLEPHVEVIQALHPDVIQKTIRDVSEGFLSDADLKRMEKLLIRRQQQLPRILQKCVQKCLQE